jgi:hypothetical protein
MFIHGACTAKTDKFGGALGASMRRYQARNNIQLAILCLK